MHGPADAESLVIDPPPSAWKRLAGARLAPAVAAPFRAQLGLPDRRPLIMTGHQAEFWHPGILAKYLAADAASRALGGAAAWLIADQDDPPADTVVRYPTREADGRPAARQIDVAGLSGPAPRSSFGFVSSGLDRIVAAWRAHEGESSAPRRLGASLRDLLAPLGPAAPTVFATEIARTELFRAFVDAMRRDPWACASAHDNAAAAHRSAGIRPLVSDGARRIELPLWHAQPGQPRRRVLADTLASIPLHELAPRAVLLTGLMRLAGCDLFIHGTGGGGGETREGYDRVTEDWLQRWARHDRAVADILGPGLAPSAVVTATRLLPIADEVLPRAADVASARWLAHHARHDPRALDDQRAAAEKRELVEAIASAPRHGPQRADLFRRMHESLEQIRREHGPRLEALARQADAIRVRHEATAVAQDRTWPFPIYPEATLLALRDEVRARFGEA